jgi:hypothetical protein
MDGGYGDIGLRCKRVIKEVPRHPLARGDGLCVVMPPWLLSTSSHDPVRNEDINDWR